MRQIGQVSGGKALQFVKFDQSFKSFLSQVFFSLKGWNQLLRHIADTRCPTFSNTRWRGAKRRQSTSDFRKHQIKVL